MKKLWFVALLSFASAQVPVTAFGFDAEVSLPAGARSVQGEECDAYFEDFRLGAPWPGVHHECYRVEAEDEHVLYHVSLEMLRANYELLSEDASESELKQTYFTPDGAGLFLSFYFAEGGVVILAVSNISF